MANQTTARFVDVLQENGTVKKRWVNDKKPVTQNNRIAKIQQSVWGSKGDTTPVAPQQSLADLVLFVDGRRQKPLPGTETARIYDLLLKGRGRTFAKICEDFGHDKQAIKTIRNLIDSKRIVFGPPENFKPSFPSSPVKCKKSPRVRQLKGTLAQRESAMKPELMEIRMKKSRDYGKALMIMQKSPRPKTIAAKLYNMLHEHKGKLYEQIVPVLPHDMKIHFHGLREYGYITFVDPAALVQDA